VKAAILPLAKKPELTSVARELFEQVQDTLNVMVDYDETANIGKRYRRQDEIGTPYCVTVDFDSLEDNAVTVRDRDSMDQVRVPISDVAEWLRGRIF
jgi:glycyl-tRNA synthetase